MKYELETHPFNEMTPGSSEDEREKFSVQEEGNWIFPSLLFYSQFVYVLTFLPPWGWTVEVFMCVCCLLLDLPCACSFWCSTRIVAREIESIIIIVFRPLVTVKHQHRNALLSPWETSFCLWTHVPSLSSPSSPSRVSSYSPGKRDATPNQLEASPQLPKLCTL